MELRGRVNVYALSLRLVLACAVRVRGARASPGFLSALNIHALKKVPLGLLTLRLELPNIIDVVGVVRGLETRDLSICRSLLFCVSFLKYASCAGRAAAGRLR